MVVGFDKSFLFFGINVTIKLFLLLSNIINVLYSYYYYSMKLKCVTNLFRSKEFILHNPQFSTVFDG